MNNKTALLEIGIEELPSSEIKGIKGQVNEKLSKMLEINRLSHTDFKVFTASRRFGILINGLSEKQESFEEKKRGPAEKIAFKDGEPTRALQGFLKSNSCSLEDVIIEEVNGVNYVFINKRVEGIETVKLLPKIFSELINKLDFKKPMRWGDGTYKFVRPVRWIVAMLDSEVLELELFGKKASDTSMGHRFLAEDVTVTPDSYFARLKEAYVIADNEERRNRVLDELKRIENERGLSIPKDEELIDEVVSLTEYPTAVVGEFFDKYLELPPEVIIVTIKHHQRTFPAYDRRNITKNFAAFQDGYSDPVGNIKKGYEEVINARLEDAYFYYQKDLENKLSAYGDSLKGMVFQRGLGSVYDKCQRTTALSRNIASLLNAKDTEIEDIVKTAEYSKADQATRLVQEFPEVQGVMGRIYALASGENENVAWGIQEHYEPLNDVPDTLTGAVVGVADRIDTLMGNFAIGNIPSGSKDPYALRRKLTFIFKTMIFFGWDIDLKELFQSSAEELSASPDAMDTIFKFVNSRYESYLIDQGYSINVTRAVSHWWEKPYIGEIAASSISELIGHKDFADLLIAYQRVHNISKKHDSTEFDGAIFTEETEKKLLNSYVETVNRVEGCLERRDFPAALEKLVAMKEDIDNYFNDIFVMSEQMDIRINRLGFLKALDSLFLKIGDLSQLVEEEKK